MGHTAYARRCPTAAICQAPVCGSRLGEEPVTRSGVVSFVTIGWITADRPLAAAVAALVETALTMGGRPIGPGLFRNRCGSLRYFLNDDFSFAREWPLITLQDAPEIGD